MTRGLIAGTSGAAFAVAAGSLMLANGFSGGGGARVALYVVFLVATLTLLAGAIAYSEGSIDQLAAARATLPRRRVRTAIKRAGHRTGRATRNGVRFVARASRIGPQTLGAKLESALTPERRHAVLRALGLEHIEAPPAPKPYAVAHARRKAMATSPITRRYNAFEARRGAQTRVARVASR
jgi:hypothetical protein